MPFTGTPTVELAGKHLARITGLSLAGAAAGVIDSSVLTSAFHIDSTEGLKWAKVTVHEVAAPAAGTPTLRVAKSGTPIDTITITNQDADNATGELEIMVENPHTIGR